MPGPLYTCLLTLCLTLVVHVAPCRAQMPEPEAYRPTVEAAPRELTAHHYDEARILFARAHALYPNARTLRGLGYADFELRHYVACVCRLEQALNTPERALEGELREDTERLLTRAHAFVGTLLVEAEPSAAELVADGVEVPTVSGQLEAGTHQVELYARRGGLPVKRTVALAGGDQ